MNCKITIVPAFNGDSFLLEVGETFILIDGGYVDTYKKYIKPLLMKMHKNGIELSHLIITHIDADHISGAIKLLEENQDGAIAKINNIWHNSYRHLQSQQSVLKGTTNSKSSIKNILKERVNKNGSISAKQGSTFGALILKGNYN